MSKGETNSKVKPRYRGVSHKWGFFISLLVGIWLIAETTTESARTVAIIYATSLVALLGVSAIYHIIHWTPEKRQWMRRLDHTMIFVLIAGSYTPICNLVLEGPIAQTTLAIVWGGVVAGAIYNLIWLNGPKWIMTVLCIGVGWVAVVTLNQLYEKLGITFMIWLGLGGLLYTIGAIIYALKKPDPFPESFGYHEIFHALVLAAAGCHFIAFKVYIFDPLAA